MRYLLILLLFFLSHNSKSQRYVSRESYLYPNVMSSQVVYQDKMVWIDRYPNMIYLSTSTLRWTIRVYERVETKQMGILTYETFKGTSDEVGVFVGYMSYKDGTLESIGIRYGFSLVVFKIYRKLEDI